jgi:DNA-binding MarR family transcriptional regulator
MAQDDPSVEAWLEIVGTYRVVHVLLNHLLVKSRLTFAQYRVVRVLGRFGEMPMNRIGRHILVTPGSITGLVDRLEGKGLIERGGAGPDRRVTTVRLTQKGEDLYKRTAAQHRELIGRIMGVLSKQEQVNITRHLQSVKEAALEERRKNRDESR